METWKEIRGYEGLYECGTHGRVRTIARVAICKNGRPKTLRQRVLIPHFNTNGYLWVFLTKDSVKRFWLIHRLIALTFVENPDGKTFVNHRSGIKTANIPANLEWVTRKENVSHAFRTGLMSHAGDKNSQSRLTAIQVAIIRRDCPPGTKVTKVLAEKYKDQIGVRRLREVINMKCWIGIEAAA